MKWKLIWPVLATLVVPLVVGFFYYPDHFPKGFLVFPPQFEVASPRFNLFYFIVMALAVGWAFFILAFPKLMGFKPGGPKPPKPQKAKFPWWFGAGLVTTLFCWWLMWAKDPNLLPLAYYSFTPLWWGFIFVLDGAVYRINDGRSMVSKTPGLLAITAVVSLVGWSYFEYFDYFVMENWYYPDAFGTKLSDKTVVMLYLIAYTTVTPVIMQWYTLLASIPALRVRYQFGYRWPLSGDVLIWGGLALIAGVVFFPNLLFWGIWVGPLAVMTGVLHKNGIWNPMQGILTNGNWTTAALVGLASLFNGFFWEMWNYGSVFHSQADYTITNPNYWVYDVPYINLDWLHLPTEMPLLGYMGYVPFGILVWQCLIWSGVVFGFKTDLSAITGDIEARADSSETESEAKEIAV